MGKRNSEEAPRGNAVCHANAAENLVVFNAKDINQEVLDIFWKLASNSIEERIENATLLRRMCESVDEVPTSSGKAQPSELDLALPSASPLLRYCLKRLIKGLSSARESARQGFSLALSGLIPVLIEQLDDDNGAISSLVEYMNQLFSKKDGQEVIGHVFGLGAIVSSDISVMNLLTPTDIVVLVKGLVELGKLKSFVKEASGELLVELAYRVREEKTLLVAYFSCAGLKEELETQVDVGGGGDATVVALAMQLWPWMSSELVAGCPALPDGVPAPSVATMFPSEETGSQRRAKVSKVDEKVCKGFFAMEHLEALRPWLKATTASHPHMHGCWRAMLRLLMCGSVEIRDHTSLQNFWSVLVEEELFDSQSHEKKYLGMTIFGHLLPLVGTEGLKILITQRFVRCLGNNANNKQTYLNKASLQAVELLAEKIKEAPADDAADLVAVIRKFGGNQLAHKIASGVPQAKDKTSDMMADIVELLKKAAAGDTSYLFHLSKVPGIIKKHQNEPASCEALFKGLIDAFVAEQQKEGVSEEGENLPVKIFGSLLNGIGLLSKSHASIEALVQVEVSLLDYIIDREDLGINIEPSKALTELRKVVWAKVASADSSIDSKKLSHFLHLVCLLEMYSFVNPASSDDEMIEDLQNVFKECFASKKKKRKSTRAGAGVESDVFWADVLVDCVLSIISRNEAPYPSAPLRDAGELLFRYFSADVTRQGLASLFDVLVQSLDGAANQAHEPEDDDDGDADEMDIDDPGSSSEEEEEEDDEGAIDDEMPEAAANNESDEEDPMDATDEQMFKMDSMLGAYFASHQVKSKKQLRDDLINFKLRVMSCLEIYMRLQPESSLLLEAPEPLLTSLSAVSRPEGSQVLQERLVGLIKNKLSRCRCTDMSAIRASAAGDDEDLASASESIEQQLRKSLYLASRTPVKIVAESAAATYAYLQRCLHNIEGADAEGLESIADESLQAALDDFFTKKKSKLGKSFFPDLFKKVPTLVPAAFTTLIEQTANARSPYLQNEALLLLGCAVNMIDDEAAKALFADNQEATNAMLASFDSSGKGNKSVAKTLNKINALLQI